MGKKIGLDELFNTTSYKRGKEYMRTDKPSRRKLYVEIYEFKDKELLSKLPCAKEEKTDEPKEAIILFDVGTKDIIRMKLKALNRVEISVMRIREYAIQYEVEVKDVIDVMKNGNYHIFGNSITTDPTADFERWYLVSMRNGNIIGFFNVAWNSQIDRTNKVLKHGGDITTIGVIEDRKLAAEMYKVMNALREREEFNKLPMMSIRDEYGNMLDREMWTSIAAVRLGYYIPKVTLEKYPDYNTIFAYYKRPPLNEFGNPEVQAAWITQFKENFEARWHAEHHISREGLSETEHLGKMAQDKVEMVEAQRMALDTELSRRQTEYNTRLNRWKLEVERGLGDCGTDMIEASVYGAIFGLSKNRTERRREEETDDNDDEDMDSNPCDNCEEMGTTYCRDSCDHSSCGDCDGENCTHCEYRGN